ncbi:MAG: hypothetical protein IPL78_31960 [Chloroflexi bacterium]|nr:hypothetical protein [Chloroflexota bacterium]
MSNKKYICVDLDGTIAHYDVWIGPEHFGEPIDGVHEALKALQEAGWLIIIFTTRHQVDLIRRYLESHQIPFDYINENPDQPDGAWAGKPFADVYVDDRAVQFNGDWLATLQEVTHFKPWGVRHSA